MINLADLYMQLKSYIFADLGPLGCNVFRLSTQSIGDATWTGIGFDNELEDIDGCHDNSTNNTRLTAIAEGTYIVTGNAGWESNSTGRRGLCIRHTAFVGGAETLYGRLVVAAVVADPIHLSSSALVRMEVGDYVELCGYQNSGGNLNISYSSGNRSNFAMIRVA